MRLSSPRSAKRSIRQNSIRDLVAGGLDDRLPQRGVGGQLLGETVRSRPNRDQADRQQLLAHLGFGERRSNRRTQLPGKFLRAAGRQPHPVPAVGDQIDAVLLQGWYFRQEGRTRSAAHSQIFDSASTMLRDRVRNGDNAEGQMAADEVA